MNTTQHNGTEIIQILSEYFNSLKPDLHKFHGNPAPALAERLIIFINKMTPYAYLFDDSFKIEIKKYIETYKAARKGEKQGEGIFKLVKPTNDLISSTLEKFLVSEEDLAKDWNKKEEEEAWKHL